MMKKLVLIFLPAVLFVGFLTIQNKRPRGFTLKKIQSKHTPSSQWDIDPIGLPELLEVRQILSQPYTYLGSGNHSYSFASQDGKYVVKFFKQKHMKTDLFPWQKEKIKRRTQERNDSFTSYKIAYEKLKEETGLVFLHLNPTDSLKIQTQFVDQHGKPFILEMDTMEFLVQKKAILTLDQLKEWFDQGEIEAAMRGIASFYELILSRQKCGIFDKDLQLFKNFGFVGEMPIEIDIGEFRVATLSETAKKDDLNLIAGQFRTWIHENYPAHLPNFEAITKIILEEE